MKKLFLLIPFGFLLCCNQPANKPAQQEVDQNKPEAAFSDLFQDIIVVKMHLFSAWDLESEQDYPYEGKPIPAALQNNLGDDLLKNADKGLFACYKMQDDFYVLRVAAKHSVPSDLVLCKVDASCGKLKKVADLSHVLCDERHCSQQDAWLTDLDLDKHLELITRSRNTDEKGETVEKDFIVMRQDANGNFVRGKEDLVMKRSYIFAELASR